MKIKKGDTVVVIAGKDKGAKGKVIAAYPRLDKVLVEGVNRVKRHERIRTTQRGASSMTFAASPSFAARRRALSVMTSSRSMPRTLPWGPAAKCQTQVTSVAPATSLLRATDTPPTKFMWACAIGSIISPAAPVACSQSIDQGITW